MSEPSFRYESWAVTHQGKVRELNEDSYLVEPAAGLWLVADGMGGYEAGEVASSGIVAHLSTIGKSSSASDQHARFIDRLTHANAELQAYSAARDGVTIGSTVAALLAFKGQYRCLWAGDSRVYLLRRGRLRQLSRDHSEAQEMVETGLLSEEEARTWHRRNVITRAVGIEPEVTVEVVYGTIEHGDSYILCSDGLTAHASDEDIGAAAAGRRPRDACERLLELTLSRGATDNVTIIIVQCWNDDSTVPVSTMKRPADR